MRLLVDFLCRFGWGMAAALAVTPASLVPAGFFRVNLLVVLGLASVAAFLARAEVPGPAWMLAAGASVVAWLGSIAWFGERTRAGMTLCRVAAVLLAAATVLVQPRSGAAAACEALIREGETPGEMYVVLSTTAPLVVLQGSESSAEPRLIAELTPPTVLGEIGMWRGRPAVATVLSREPNRLDVLVIDAATFESLKHEPGFRAATAAEVQRRLSINTALMGTQLEDAAARSGDPMLASIAQLFRYLTGDSHVALDAVIDLTEDATSMECVEALRRQVDRVIAGGGRSPDLVRYLQQVVATIG